MEPIPLHHVWNYTDIDRAFWQKHLADWLPTRIVDAHVHMAELARNLVEPDETMLKSYWVCEVSRPHSAETLARCMKTVYPGRDISTLCFGHPSLDFDLDGMNADTSKECTARGWNGLAVSQPMWDAPETERILDLPGIIGLKPYYAMLGPSDEGRDKYIEASIFDFLPHHQLEVVNQRCGWVTLHVPKADRLGHPDNIREIKEIRRRYPDIILVIAHLGRCYTEPHAREALPQLADDPELYFDNSAVLNPAVHRLALEIIGPERILYGTDNPVFYMRGRRQWEGRTYVNRTNHPFHFNQNRETPEVEATYTLFMYEALLAIKKACADIRLTRAQIEAIFYGTADRLISKVVSAKTNEAERIRRIREKSPERR